jgi:hypothetical protein
VGAKGGYALTGVLPGRYRAVVWAERLPATERVVDIGPGERRTLDWVIGSPE